MNRPNPPAEVMARHFSVQEIMRYFNYEHLPAQLTQTSKIIHDAALEIVNEIPADSPELTTGLRKLLEAKDCFVRAKLSS